MEKIVKIYENLKKCFKIDPISNEITDLINNLVTESWEILKTFDKLELISKIQDKKYFAFIRNKKISRAVNIELFNEANYESILPLSNDLFDKNSTEITKIVYSISMIFFCVIDIEKNGDQKTPATFFEYLIGHLFAKRFKVNPRNQLEVLNLDMKAKLPTDYIFDLGDRKPKFHVPIKTSTRERVVQVWAHQKVLDGIYGMGRFLGILVCLAETKLDLKKQEVIEICLPDQWRIYQMFIAQLKRIYYLDVPKRYEELNLIFPKIPVKQFGDFFHEANTLMEI